MLVFDRLQDVSSTLTASNFLLCFLFPLLLRFSLFVLFFCWIDMLTSSCTFGMIEMDGRTQCFANSSE